MVISAEFACSLCHGNYTKTMLDHKHQPTPLKAPWVQLQCLDLDLQHPKRGEKLIFWPYQLVYMHTNKRIIIR